MSKRRRQGSDDGRKPNRKKQRTVIRFKDRAVFVFRSNAVETETSSCKLSNFYEASFVVDDEKYVSVEHFYQGQKVNEPYRSMFKVGGCYSDPMSPESTALFISNVKGWSKLNDAEREKALAAKRAWWGLGPTASVIKAAKKPAGILAKMANSALRREQKQYPDRKIASAFTKRLVESKEPVLYTEARRVMMPALRAKFTQNPELQQKLLSTGTMYLLEQAGRQTNVWNGRLEVEEDGEEETQLRGANYLGKLLMELRQELLAKKGNAEKVGENN